MWLARRHGPRYSRTASRTSIFIFLPMRCCSLWIAGITAGLTAGDQRDKTMSVGNVRFVDVKAVVVK